MNRIEKSSRSKIMGFVVDIWFLNDSSAEGPLSPIVNLRLRMWVARVVVGISRAVGVVG